MLTDGGPKAMERRRDARACRDHERVEDGSMRFLAWIVRVAGCLVLAAATALAVGDIARSLASGATTLMPLEAAARTVGLSLFDAAAATGVFAAEGRGASLASEIGRQPASIVLGLAGVLLLLVGRPPRRATRTLR